MGNFYCNITTCGPPAEEIVRVLVEHSRSAYVTPTIARKTVVFDEAADELDQTQIDTVGSLLSREFACPALAVAMADDDELCLALYEAGEPRVRYSSRGAKGGAYALCRAFGKRWNFPVAWALLQLPYVVFESWRHALLAKALGLPEWSVATGFRYIQQDELPDGLQQSDLRWTDRGT